MTRTDTPAWRRDIAQWPEDWQEEWSERAAIIEYDGGLPRDQAERAAFDIVRARMGDD